MKSGTKYNISRCFPIYPYPILLIEMSDSKKFLVISDIHLGFEDKIRRNGILMDAKKNVNELIEFLTTLYFKTEIKNLIILGDLKSSIQVISRSEWEIVPYFINELIKLFDIYLVPGNHDGNIKQLLPENVNIMLSKGMEINNILFTHGHTVRHINSNLEKIIVGHLHPVLLKEGSILNGNKVWVKIFLSKKELRTHEENETNRVIELIIIPHFNKLLDYYVSLHRNSVKSSTKSRLPLLDTMINKQNWTIENAYLFSLEGAIIGSVEELQSMLF